MPRPKSGGMGTSYTPKRAHAVTARRRRSAVTGKTIVMTGDIGAGEEAVKQAPNDEEPPGWTALAYSA